MTEANLTEAENAKPEECFRGTDASHVEDPGAVIPHTEICEGAVG